MMVASSIEKAARPPAASPPPQTTTTTAISAPATAAATTSAKAPANPRVVGKRVRKSFGSRFFWGLVVASYDVGGAPFFKVRFDDGDVDVFAAPEVLQDIKQAEKHARDDKAAPSASALKLQMLAQSGATAYEDEVKRTALKRKRGEERSVRVTPASADDAAESSVELTVWSSRLHVSIVTSRKLTSIAEFVRQEDGSPGELEATGLVAAGDIITHIGGHIIHGLSSATVSEMIRTASRPLTIVFRKREDEAARRAASPTLETADQASSPLTQRERAEQPSHAQSPASVVAQSSPAHSPPTPSTSVATPSAAATIPRTTQDRAARSSTAVGSMPFVQPPPQPAFGAPHPSMHATASATQQEYAAAVRANPWNQTYGGTALPMRSAPMPAYGMHVPMDPQAQLLRQPQSSVVATANHFSQHPATSSFVRYQPHPPGASMPTQRYIQQLYTSATSMLPVHSSQHAGAAPQRTYARLDARPPGRASGDTSTVRQSSSGALGDQSQQTQSMLRHSDETRGDVRLVGKYRLSYSPPSSPTLKDESHSSGQEKSSSSASSSRKSSARSQQRAVVLVDDGDESDEPMHVKHRSSHEPDDTTSADELAAVLGEELSDPHAEPPASSSSSSAAAAKAAAAKAISAEMSFLKPNMTSFVARLPGDSAPRREPYVSFQELQRVPRMTSRFALFDGEECAIVLIQQSRLNVTLSPLGRHVSISSFARGEGGEMGEIEESGKVFVGDIIVGVNGMRLTPELSPTAVGRLLVSLIRPFEIYFKPASWEVLEGNMD